MHASQMKDLLSSGPSDAVSDWPSLNALLNTGLGATWVSLHNGGGVGWGEVVNGGFGMVIDGSEDSARRIHSMLHWDVNNGVARRAWARNSGAIEAIKQSMNDDSELLVTLPYIADDDILDDLLG